MDHVVTLFLVLWGTSLLFSIYALLIYIPSYSVQELLFLHILTSICYFYYIFDKSYLNWSEMAVCYTLICISLVANDTNHFHAFMGYFISSFEKCLFRSFAHFIFILFYFIVFTFTYMCIHYLGHLPATHHFHARVYWNPHWFISTRPLHYSLVPFP
jgi:hypothetical protein